MVAKPPHIRSYCGTPIVLANGYRVGVLCALDTKPHAMCASSTRLMVNVAGLIAREIEGLAGADYDLPLQPKVPTPFPAPVYLVYLFTLLCSDSRACACFL